MIPPQCSTIRWLLGDVQWWKFNSVKTKNFTLSQRLGLSLEKNLCLGRGGDESQAEDELFGV